jgi:hypothetical protein
MLDDVIKTVKAQLYDRATSPLSGAFILSWCGWNWKFLFLLISDMPVMQKFSYAEATLYPTFFASMLTGFIYPLLTTAFIIFIYPIPARFVYGYWRNQQKKQKEIQQKIDDEEPLTKEEARKIRSSALQLEISYEEEREQREARIKELESAVKSIQDKTEKPSLTSSPRRNNKSENIDEANSHVAEKLQILQRVAEDKFISRDRFTNGLPTNESIKVEHFIDVLVKGNYLNEGYERAVGKEALSIRPDGRTALVNGKFSN